MRRRPSRSFWDFLGRRREAWPGEDWGTHALYEVIAARTHDPALQCHLAAAATCGRAVSPFLAGTALHLLTMERSGAPAAGLGALAEAMVKAVEAAGVTLRCTAEIASMKIEKGRATAAVLAGGEEIAARAFLSTLDVKRSVLNLLSWNALPASFVRRVGRFRMHGAAARVLFALDRVPEFAFAREAPEAARGPIHIVPSLRALSVAQDWWRAAKLADSLPVTLRVFAHPRAAPLAKAVMTATVSGVPPRLIDGPWSELKRSEVVKLAFAAAERASPGVTNLVVAFRAFLPGDIEGNLGITDGDLDGGEIAPDQVLADRPFPDWKDGRTPVRGYYIGGPSASPSPFASGAAGIRAAKVVLADLKGGRLR